MTLQSWKRNLTYKVRIQKKVEKEIAKIPKKQRDKVIQAIKFLGKNPHPVGSSKLTNRDGWRIRVANYRIIYSVRDEELLVLVVKVGHRKDVYRK